MQSYNLRRIGRFSGLLFILLSVCFAGWYLFFRTEPDSTVAVQSESIEPLPDPRLTYETPFRNVHPSAKYVGDAACANCHKEIDGSFHQHPMGRSAAFVGQESPLESYGVPSQNPIQLPTHSLTILRNETGTVHRLAGATPVTSTLPASDSKIDLVIGSGTRGRSYLTFDHGSVWQTGVSWFTDEARWNLSPGFELGKGGRRAIPPSCLFCHLNQSEPVPESINMYRKPVVGQPSIGCERCHGPGELHARHQANSPPAGTDYTIVNPKHLSAELQLDICRQCHLQGEVRVVRRGRDLFEYRPGLPLDLFQTTFVQPPEKSDSQKSVGQFEQMEKSVCFNKSKQAMTCTTCHDPHAATAKLDRDAFYSAKCVSCHAERGCSQAEPLRAEKNNSCVACHMPRRDSANIAHASVTDHRILRKADQLSAPPAGVGTGLPIVQYRHGTNRVRTEEIDRDFGIALAIQVPKIADGNIARAAATSAKGLLSLATTRFPDDALAWEAWGSVRDPLGRVQALRKAASLLPDSEQVLFSQAIAEGMAKEYPTALALTDRLIRMNPASIEHRQLRASILITMRDWAGAEKACREAISVNPMAAEPRALLRMSLNAQGKREEAKQQGEIALALEYNPAVQKEYRQWFGR
jgi:predicted CXXCH cytochrome family protein